MSLVNLYNNFNTIQIFDNDKLDIVRDRDAEIKTYDGVLSLNADLLEWKSRHDFSEFELGKNRICGTVIPTFSDGFSDTVYNLYISIVSDNKELKFVLSEIYKENVEVFFKKIDSIFIKDFGYLCFVVSEYDMDSGKKNSMFIRPFRIIVLNKDGLFVAISENMSNTDIRVNFEYCNDVKLNTLAKCKSVHDIALSILN